MNDLVFICNYFSGSKWVLAVMCDIMGPIPYDAHTRATLNPYHS